MKRQCLICGSRILLSRGEAGGLTMLLGVTGTLVHGIKEASEKNRSFNRSRGGDNAVRSGLTACLAGLDAVSLASAKIGEFRADMIRHHFMGQRYLCLRCGARQDRAT